MKNKTRVYDLPTRLFHWLFAAGFLGAFFIAKTVDDDSPTYAYHMLLGLSLALLVVLRVIWGFVGSRYARFSSFQLSPRALAGYGKRLITSKTDRTLGHNPASSWAALVMMALALGLAVTGYLMTSGGDKEAIEDVHELLANAFIAVVIAHVAGIVFHRLRHRECIGLSMVHGRKEPVDGEPGIERNHGGVALVFLALIGAFVFHLSSSYDSTTQRLALFGGSLQLGEAEKGGHDEGRSKHGRDDNDGMEDHDD